MKRLIVIGLAACAFALAPYHATQAMPIANPATLSSSAHDTTQLRVGWHGHGHHYGWGGGRGHHYGWYHGHGHHHG
jgi:hypothetical protein